jgi:CRISPR-associated Csx2 family protein
MARKILLSFLGTNNYLDCNYYLEGQPNKKVENVKYIQDALVQLYAKDFSSQDQVLLFLTEKAEKMNFWDNGQLNNKTKEYNHPNIGLNSKLEILQKEGYQFQIHHKRIKEGFSQEEVWSIFETIADEIQEGDQIILDITHAFRFLPMLGIVLLNYLKTTKNIAVLGIHYGAFEKLGSFQEVKEMKIEDLNAPIIDLKTLLEFQSWTSAVGSFIKFGEASALQEVSQKPLSYLLKNPETRDQVNQDSNQVIKNLLELTQSLQTNRLNILINQDLKGYSEKLIRLQSSSSEIKPFKQIFKLLEEKTIGIANAKSLRWLEAVKWCISHNYIQQAFTQFQEGLLTHFIIELNQLIKKEDERVEFIPLIKIGKIDYLDQTSRENCKEILFATYTKQQKGTVPDEFENVVQAVIEIGYGELANIFVQIGTPRNDINHAGMRSMPSPAKNFKIVIEKFISRVEKIFEDRSNIEFDKDESNYFGDQLLNLSNHPSSTWHEQQRDAAKKLYGSIIDLPFPQIDPQDDEDYVHKLALNFLNQIRELKPAAVHLMGELTFTFKLVELLKSHGITVLASTTLRTTQDLSDGTKISKFEFVQFRSY